MASTGRFLLDTNGEIKNRLRAKGRAIPENDIWIAAIAMQYQLIMVACDGHFHEVGGS